MEDLYHGRSSIEYLDLKVAGEAAWVSTGAAVGGFIAFTAEAVKRIGIPACVLVAVAGRLTGRDAVGVLFLARVTTLVATPRLIAFVAEAFLLVGVPVRVLVDGAVVNALKFFLDARVSSVVRSRSIAVVAEASTVLPVCIVVSRAVTVGDYNTLHGHGAHERTDKHGSSSGHV